MSVISFRVRGKSGDYVRTGIVPANHSEASHFGALDLAVIGFIGLCLAGVLVFLLI